MELSQFLVIGITMGFWAGISPGPLMTFVTIATLRMGLRQGIITSGAPLITDGTIIIISYLFLNEIKKIHLVLPIISLFGAIFLIYLGWQNFKLTSKDFQVDNTDIRMNSFNKKESIFIKAVIVNFLSPHPYIFWFTIGAPILHQAQNFSHQVQFILGFYLLLIGSKVTLALTTHFARSWLLNILPLLNKLFGVALWIFALLLLKQSAKIFNKIRIFLQ